MGYHQRLARIPKSTKNEVVGLSFEHLKNKYEDHFFITELDGYEELMYIGDIEKIQGTQFFDFNIDDYGYEFSILSKDDLKNIIEQYYKHVQKEFTNLKELLTPLCKNEQIDYAPIISHLYSKFQIWGDSGMNWRPYNLNEKQENIVDSNRYEYDIFDLVRILKTFDFENDYLILSGW